MHERDGGEEVVLHLEVEAASEEVAHYTAPVCTRQHLREQGGMMDELLDTEGKGVLEQETAPAQLLQPCAVHTEEKYFRWKEHMQDHSRALTQS